MIEEVIRKHALFNAYKYGKAELKPVIAKVFAEVKEAKKNAKQVVELARKIVDEVNRLSKDEIEAELAEKFPEMLEEKPKETRKELPPLPDAEPGKVVTRIPPEPNGYLHIGHAISFNINYYYARRYDGEVVLRFEDTNPLKEKVEFYGAIIRDLRWLGIEWDRLTIMSEHFDELEKLAEKLIRLGKAYVCTHSVEEIRERRAKLEPDPCREHSKSENLELWEEMKAGSPYVLRWKGDPEASNAVLRDPTLYRVIDAVHPWTGINHVVYPTYDFANPVFDALDGVTHVLRSEEFAPRVELQKAIQKALGLRSPVYIHYGRFELEGTPTSKRKIRPLVEKKLVLGWDDPRLATLVALRRRGILASALKDLAMHVGLNPGKSIISWDLLLALNKKRLDPVATRVFVVREPVKLKLEGPEKVAKVPRHPNKPELGFRELEVKENSYIYIERSDYEENLGRVVRLKDLYNVRLEKGRAVYAGDEIINPKLHWVPESSAVPGKLLEPGILFKGEEINEDSLKEFEVMAEKEILKHNFVQMERVGLGRVETRKPLQIILTSR